MAWTSDHDLVENENARAAAPDRVGGVYAIGMDVVGGAVRVRVVRYDGLGNELWVRQYDPPSPYEHSYAYVAASDASGNLLVGGSLYDEDGDEYSDLLLKYAPNGTLTWDYRQALPLGSGYAPTGIDVEPAGDIFLGGHVGNSTNLSRVTRVTSGGSHVWTTDFDAGPTAGSGPLCVSGGSVFQVGGIYQAPLQRSVVIRRDMDGSLLDSQLFDFGAGTGSSLSGIVPDGSGGVVVGGIHGSELFVAGVSSALTATWESTGVPSSGGGETALARDGSGGLYLAESFPGRVVKWDATGVLEWVLDPSVMNLNSGVVALGVDDIFLAGNFIGVGEGWRVARYDLSCPPTETPTETSTATDTSTACPSCTNTPEDTPTPTETSTMTYTPSMSSTAPVSWTLTPTPTPTRTTTWDVITPTRTSTATLTSTGSPFLTFTPTPTLTFGGVVCTVTPVGATLHNELEGLTQGGPSNGTNEDCPGEWIGTVSTGNSLEVHGSLASSGNNGNDYLPEVDRDYFRFVVGSTATYRLTLDCYGALGDGRDLDLYVFDETCNNIMGTFAGDPLEFIISPTLSQGTTFILAVMGWNAPPQSGYRLVVMEEAPGSTPTHTPSDTPTESPTITLSPTGTWYTATSTNTPTRTNTSGFMTNTATSTRTSTPTFCAPCTLTPGVTWTPTSTATTIPTCSVALFNGVESLTENGIWGGGNSTRTLSALYATEGIRSLAVSVFNPTGWNDNILVLNGFAPARWQDVTYLQVDVAVDPSLLAAGYNELQLYGDSSANSIFYHKLSSTNASLAAGTQTLTFFMDYPGSITPAMDLSGLRFILNSGPSAGGTGNLYVDNLRFLFWSCVGPPTWTPTPLETATGTDTSTPTDTFTPTQTPTGTWYTATSTNTAIPTSTRTSTSTLTRTNTGGPTRTSTNTSTRTPTPTGTNSPTLTQTYTRTATPTGTWFTETATQSFTWTETSTRTDTRTPTMTRTPTNTPVGTWFTSTFTNTSTRTLTPTPTRTPTPTGTNSPTMTQTYTRTATPTGTWFTETATQTFTRTGTSTMTDTPTDTPTFTPTNSPTITDTPTETSTLTDTRTPTNTFTATQTPTGTWYTSTFTNTTTSTLTATVTNTRTNTNTPTGTNTPTRTSTALPTATWTSSFTLTSTRTRTATTTPTLTTTGTTTGTSTSTSTAPLSSPTPTFTPTDTPGVPLATTSQPINPVLSVSASLPSGMTVAAPAGSFASPATLTLSEYAAGAAPPNVSNFSINLLPGSFLIEANGIQPLPGASVTLVFPYAPSDIPTGYTEADLTVTYYDGSAWQTVPTTLDTVNDTLMVVVDHFSWWAVAVQQKTPVVLDRPVLLRNPVVGQDPIRLGLNTHSTSDVRVRVYSLGFNLVRDVTFRAVGPAGQLQLETKDDWGQNFGNGLYYVKVGTNAGETTLKLLILR